MSCKDHTPHTKAGRKADGRLTVLPAGCPAVLASVEVLLSTGQHSRTRATVVVARDLDHCSFVLTWPPAATKEVTEEDDMVSVHFRHAIPFAVLNTFDNFDAYFTNGASSGFLAHSCRSYWRVGAAGRHGGGERVVAEMQIPLRVLAAAAEKQEVLAMVSQLRVLSLMPLFSHLASRFLDRQQHPATSTGTDSGGDSALLHAPDTSAEPVLVPYHPSKGEYLVFSASPGRFLITLNLYSPSHDTAILVQQTLRTMQEVRRSAGGGVDGESIAAAPLFTFSPAAQPPPALSPSVVADITAAGNATDATGEQPPMFWCTFQLFAHHLEGDAARFALLTSLMNFRSNVLLHIHATQSAMHALLRRRAESSLQLLGLDKGSLPMPELLPNWDEL